MKEYNFDEIINRKGTSCVKHDMMFRDFGSDDLMPMWVADMDFRSPDFVIDAIKERCKHEVLAYTFGGNSYFEAIIDWLSKHYNISARKNELHFVPGIVAAIAFAIQAFTHEGDRIVITPPVYPPFVNLPNFGKRELVCSHLKTENGRLYIDFEDFERKAKDCKMFILSNPHNPGGRVWNREELLKISEACKRNNVMVISDEIHADLTLPGFSHTSFSTISSEAQENSITFIAPSKTFNIAGMGSSVAYIPDERLRNTYFNYLDGYEVANGNVFAYTAAEAAFRHGEDWLRQVKDYIAGNVEYTMNYFKTNKPQIVPMKPEASFLVWLDFNGLKLPHEEVKRRLLEEAKIALNDGTDFGGELYKGFFRLNIGCPKAVLKEALEKICNVF